MKFMIKTVVRTPSEDEGGNTVPPDRPRTRVCLTFLLKLALCLMAGLVFISLKYPGFIKPLTEMSVFTWYLMSTLPLHLMFFNLGPLTLFISPLSLCPLPLPDFLPFQHSYICLSLFGVPLPLTDLFVNLHFCPSLTLNLPTLSSLLSLSPRPLFNASLSLISVSTVFLPLQVMALQIYNDLWPYRRREMGLRIKLFPAQCATAEELPTFAPQLLENVDMNQVEETYASVEANSKNLVDAFSAGMVLFSLQQIHRLINILRE